MSRKFLTHIDLNKNELQNAVIQQLGSAPSSPSQGQIYYNTGDDKVYVYDGAEWVELGSGSEIGGSDDITNESDVTGETVSDALETLDGDIDDLDSRLTTAEGDIDNLESDVSDLTTNKADKTYVDGLVQGLNWKDSVRAATTANVDLSSDLDNGSTVDGVTLATGDRVLVKNQSDPEQNGIYVVPASGAASRSTDADSSDDIKGMVTFVEEGTSNADTAWVLTTNAPITLNTTELTFAIMHGGNVPDATTSVKGKVELATQAEAEAKTDTTRAVTPEGLSTFTRKYAETIGDGSNTEIAVTHNLGSQDVVVSVRQVSDNAEVECDIVAGSSSSVTLTFAEAPANNSLRVTVVG